MVLSVLPVGISQRAYRIGDRSIFVTDAGTGPEILMLHGGGPGASGLSNYRENLPALARDFRVIIPDMPGYGGSTKRIDKTDPFADLARAILGLMDEMGIAKASVLGNSYGGAAALRMAMDYPERVDRLVLMGPGGIGTTRAPPTKGLSKLLNYYKRGPTRDKLAEFMRDYLVADSSIISEAMIDERFQASIDPEVVANPPLTRPSGLRTLWRMDLTRDPRLRAMRHKVLVLWGAKDKVNRPSGGQWMQKHMRHCDLHLFADAGHWVQWECRDQFNAVTKAFLQA